MRIGGEESADVAVIDVGLIDYSGCNGVLMGFLYWSNFFPNKLKNPTEKTNDAYELTARENEPDFWTVKNRE